MPSFQPIDRAMTGQDPRSSIERHLHIIENHDGSHNYPYCWGYTIFRTYYTSGSDEKFAEAVKRLNAYAKYFLEANNVVSKPIPDQRPAEPSADFELWSRYYNEIIEDPTLANASVEEVGIRFDAWVAEHLAPDPQRLDVPNSRFRLCIMLDQESIDNILEMPGDPYTDELEDPGRRTRWIKLVTGWKSWQYKGKRIRIKELINDGFVPLWFDAGDPDFWSYETIWEGEDDGMLDFTNPEVF